jgi:hypothetical protein
MFVTILSIALVALTPGGMAPSSAPVLLGGGGPDTFGYRYLDSDTTASGAPTYNWVSIKGVGTEITTLGDDNHAGPFSIGFSFPYYWYNVNSVIVGSNGYITFGDGSANASPFSPVPSTAKPNNQLAMMLSDLDCSSGGSPSGSVWYWSNGADSFIVEYDSIAFWSSGGNNTFQVILTKADSSITFQYAEQSGSPYNGWGTTNNQTGIENISGAIGLNYLSGTIPSGNAIHADLAVRFFPPESTSLQIHDVGVRNAMNDRNGGMFAINDEPLSFWAVVKNYGNQSEASYTTYFKVTRQNNAVVFSDSMTTMASEPGETESLELASTWRPATNGTYIIKIFTKMTGDMLVSNDTATLELRVVTMPGTLTYDSGTPTGSIGWLGPGGMASRFVPPVYPCSISSIRQHMTSTSSVDVLLAVYDDDGPGGSPGTILFGDTVSVNSANWYSADPTAPVVITDGAFFVGATSQTSNDPSFGYDSIPPVSFQGWENTGASWGPSRYSPTRDVCANATTSGPVGIFEELQPTPPPMTAQIDVNPNPFARGTSVNYELGSYGPVTLTVHDVSGRLVRQLESGPRKAGFHTARWDGSDGRGHIVPAGVYFVRFSAGGTVSTGRLTLVR